MVRLEGLIKGGAIGTYEACFMEHLRTLKDPLLDQMIDRCACDTSCSRWLLPFLEAPAWQLDTGISMAAWHRLPGLLSLMSLSCVRVDPCFVVQALGGDAPVCAPVCCDGCCAGHQV